MRFSPVPFQPNFFFLMRECELVVLISMELVSSRDEFQPIFFFFNARMRMVCLISMELIFSRDEFQPDFFFFYNDVRIRTRVKGI